MFPGTPGSVAAGAMGDAKDGIDRQASGQSSICDTLERPRDESIVELAMTEMSVLHRERGEVVDPVHSGTEDNYVMFRKHANGRLLSYLVYRKR